MVFAAHKPSLGSEARFPLQADVETASYKLMLDGFVLVVTESMYGYATSMRGGCFTLVRNSARKVSPSNKRVALSRAEQWPTPLVAGALDDFPNRPLAGRAPVSPDD